MTTSVKSLIPVEIAAPAGGEQRLALYGVSWETYDQLLRAFESHPSVLMTYDDGALEIMVATLEHEKWKSVLGDIVKLIATEMEIDFVSTSQTTFQIEKKKGGFEGDDSFYFSNLAWLRQQTRIDLKTDPPPDLVVEVDITSPSVGKFPLFARLGIKEVWRYHAGEVKILRPVGDEYIEQKESILLPGVTPQGVTDLVDLNPTVPAFVWHRRVREYTARCKPQ